MATAKRTWKKLGPSAAAMAMASRGLGKARKRSVMRINAVSSQPPATPATSPMRPPMTTPEVTTMTTPSKLSRSPNSTRLKMS